MTAQDIARAPALAIEWQLFAATRAAYARDCMANDRYLPRVKAAQEYAAECYRQAARFRDVAVRS